MKTTTKSAFHRGFTLIELMIVIVILGILMGTILPRLSGAQARARDTGRQANLNTIAQALELYFDDFGSYPGTTGTFYCLAVNGLNYGSGTGGDFENVFQTYFKSDTVPVPPSNGEVIDLDNTGGTVCTDGYAYLPVISSGINPGSYALLANFEVPSKGNVILTVAGFPYTGASTLTTILTNIDTPANLVAAEEPDGSTTAYMLTN